MRNFIPAIAFALLIFWLSVTSGINAPSLLSDFISWDKLAHAGVYFVLTFLLIGGYWRNNKKGMGVVWISASIAISYGIAMEFIQYGFFPNRYFELLDIIANIIGTMLCVAAIYFITK